jgi:two-component system phosphate regulon sensor histidine kinase PhoR
LENARLVDNLQHERNLLSGILADMAEGVFVVSQEGQVLLANRAAHNLLQVCEQEPLPAYLAQQLEIGREAPIGESRRQIELAGKTISISRAELSGAGDVPTSTIFVARDITQEAQVEQMKRDFVAYASHELRTPLTTIKMLVRLLLMDTPKDTKPHEYLSIISTQAERQTRLVTNLLDFTRLEAGKYELAPEEVSTQQVLQSAVSVCRPLAEEKGLRVHTDGAEAPSRIISNAGGLEQVLINLLSNAIKFTDEGGRVAISCRREGEDALFVVEDSGIGMTSEQLGRIFNKFYTVRNPRKHGEGTGLGLVISDMIVKNLGGRIEVASQPGVGRRFSVRLPNKGPPPRDSLGRLSLFLVACPGVANPPYSGFPLQS